MGLRHEVRRRIVLVADEVGQYGPREGMTANSHTSW